MTGSGVTRLFIVGERRITICPAVQRDRTTRSLSSGAHSRGPLASPGERRTASGDAIASVARMSEAIDGRHEKKRAGMPCLRRDHDRRPLRVEEKFSFRFSLFLPVQSPLQKYFASPVGQIISTNSRHPTPPEGRIMIVTDAWTRQRLACDGIAGRVERLVSDQQHADERRCCVRRSRVVLTPRRWRQVCGVASAQPGLDKTYPLATVARKPGHRGEHEISRKTIACGNVG